MTKKVQILLEDKLLHSLKVIAIQNDTSVKGLVQEIITNYLTTTHNQSSTIVQSSTIPEYTTQPITTTKVQETKKERNMRLWNEEYAKRRSEYAHIDLDELENKDIDDMTEEEERIYGYVFCFQMDTGEECYVQPLEHPLDMLQREADESKERQENRKPYDPNDPIDKMLMDFEERWK